MQVKERNWEIIRLVVIVGLFLADISLAQFRVDLSEDQVLKELVRVPNTLLNLAVMM
jgi:hypothetical protein